MYKCFKFYDEKKRRVAIFYDSGVVTVIPCSKNDEFSKKKANELYLQGTKGQKKIEVNSIQNHTTFMEWCFENFRKKVEDLIQLPGIHTVKLVGKDVLKFEYYL